MKARILALLLALVMVASLFAACSAGKTDASGASTGASQTTDDSKTTEDTKPAKTEKTKIVYNADWILSLNLKDLLGLMSKFTVARILERDDFTKRYQSQTPIAMHEFLYPIMQA